MTRGLVHESTHNETKEWYTPPEIFKALNIEFDMDVCSPGLDIVPWIPAIKHLTMFDNGLVTTWEGKVWMNPPYGSDTPKWMRLFQAHGNGIALVFARTDCAWFHDYAIKCDVLCFMRGRIRFIKANGERGGTPGAGSLLIASGDECVASLKNSNLGYIINDY